PRHKRTHPFSAGHHLGIRRHLQSRRRFSQRQIHHALPRPGFRRHVPPRLRRKHRRPTIHSPLPASALSRSRLRKRRRRRGSSPPEIQRHLLPHVHRLQQKGCPALSRHIARSHPLGPQRRDPSRLPRKLEQRLDQIRRHRPRKNQRQILDVLARHGRRQDRSNGPLLFHRSDPLDRSYYNARSSP